MMKMKLKSIKLNVNKKFVNIVILAVFFTVIFLVSIFARIYLSGNQSLPGQEAYLNVNIAKDILSFQGDFVLNNWAIQEIIWPVIIAAFSFITRLPLEFSMGFLSLIFGILSTIIIYLIIEKIGFKKRNLAIAFFLISPATIWLFSTFSKFIVPFFLSLLTLYLLLVEKRFMAWVLVALTSIFGLVSSISVLILCILGYWKGFVKWFWKAALVSAAINLVLYLFFPYILGFGFSMNNIFLLFFSLSEYGVSMFAFLLAFIGIFATWKERKERRELFLIYLVFILLFIFSIINKEFIFFFNFSLIFLAVIGFSKLWEREWASILIRNLTLGLLIVGLLFPLIFMPLRIATSPPGDDLIIALESLKDNEPGKVLNVKENGYWIKSFSGQEAFVDEFKAKVNPELDKRAIELFLERNIEKLSEGFKKEEIRYVLLEEKARQLFSTDDEGILLLLQHTEMFKRIYNKNNIEIWEFTSPLEAVA